MSRSSLLVSTALALCAASCLDTHVGQQADDSTATRTPTDTASSPDTTPPPDTTPAPDAASSPDTTPPPDTTSPPETTSPPDTASSPETTSPPDTAAPSCAEIGGACTDDEGCCSGICDYQGPYVLESWCVAPRPLGTPCRADHWCESGFCVNGLCAAGACLEVGQDCSWDERRCCAPSFCSWTGAYVPGYCTAPLPPGGSCVEHGWCQSGTCGEDGVCL